MKHVTAKDSNLDRLKNRAAERPSSSVTVSSTAQVSHASTEWKKYCDGRLRHFAMGR